MIFLLFDCFLFFKLNNFGLILEGSDSFLELECHLQSSGQVVANQQLEIADLQSLCRMLSRVSYSLYSLFLYSLQILHLLIHSYVYYNHL